MCKHSSVLTLETCGTCSEIESNKVPMYVYDAPIYEGMTEIDNEAMKFKRGKRNYGSGFLRRVSRNRFGKKKG